MRVVVRVQVPAEADVVISAKPLTAKVKVVLGGLPGQQGPKGDTPDTDLDYSLLFENAIA